MVSAARAPGCRRQSFGVLPGESLMSDRDFPHLLHPLNSPAPNARGRQLCVGDLAYLLTPRTGFKMEVQGPLKSFKFPGIQAGRNQAGLRTTPAVRGQRPVEFTVHVHRVARCKTIATAP
jgi:hypothetical protein